VPLLNGVNPVPDSYFTASTDKIGYEAYRARLDGNNNWWSPKSSDINAIPPTLFVQVRQIQLKRKPPRKHSLHGKIAASVLLSYY